MLKELELSWQIFEKYSNLKYSNLNFQEYPAVGTELYHADGLTDRHNESNIRFSNFVNAPKNRQSVHDE